MHLLEKMLRTTEREAGEEIMTTMKGKEGDVAAGGETEQR